ncbi:zf-HC2 domain-containing protein [Actinoplanes subtropicus]|uniref:zf-HC2 domain-containing protein n=1 Tax=Actinoplanes subtropicus TaxID=543632 RepID=UPI0004C4640E|nr:zf-HC2 domain-containing protein [Actinoplanes subtropicus]
MNEFLAEYAAGTLPPPRADEVRRHLSGCAECRADLAAWRALAGPGEPVAPPGPRIVAAALVRGLSPIPATGPRWRLPLALARAQLRIIPALIWVASALALAVGVLVVRHDPHLFALVTPLVAAMGIAGVAGTEHDPAVEITAATPTPPRLVLLTRVTLVLGFDVALSLAGSALLGTLGAGLGDWLGPAALLSALSLLGAVTVGAEAAAVVVAVSWTLRLAWSDWFDQRWAWLIPIRALWDTNAETLGGALLLAALAVFLAGHREPRRVRRATPLT